MVKIFPLKARFFFSFWDHLNSRFLTPCHDFYHKWRILRLFTLSRDILCSDVSIQVDSRLELKDVNFMLLQHERLVSIHTEPRLWNYRMKTWKTLKLGKAVCFWQITRKSPLILQFFVILFCVWAMNKYYTVAVCCSRSKKRPDLNYGCFPIKTDDHNKSDVLWKRADKKLQQTNWSKNKPANNFFL